MWLLRFLGIVGLTVWLGAAAFGERPNVVLVMADDQGWGDMAYNGHPVLRTPNFDTMAAEGIRFNRFYAAAPVCTPTRASVLTGRTPNRTGALTWGHTMRPQEVTLAERLRAAGYRTGHFGKWHLGSVQAGSPVNPGGQGFDEWVSSPNFFDLNPILSDKGKAIPFEGDSSEVTVDLALRFIRENAEEERPFLAVVWFGSPHLPFEALEEDRAPYAGESKAKANFYGEIAAMDRAFGRLRNGLKEMGLRENTILWYCSDNGALKNVGSAGGFRGLKGDVYEGGLLVPSLLEWPARLEAPQTVSERMVTSDIFPTVLEAAGLSAESGRPLDGVSLLPLLTGKVEERASPIGFWHHPVRGKRVPAKEWMEELHKTQLAGGEPELSPELGADAGRVEMEMATEGSFPGHAAWLRGNWKLHRIEPGKKPVRWELYDLEKDPGETRDVWAEKGELAAEMRSDLEGWLRSVAASNNGADYR